MLSDEHSSSDEQNSSVDNDLREILDAMDEPGVAATSLSPVTAASPLPTAADVVPAPRAAADADLAPLTDAGAHASPPTAHNKQQADAGPQTELNPSDGLDETTLEILGDDPTAKVEYGASVHKEIANRFEHFAISGLEKDVRKELTNKYLVPDNCVRTGAPILNEEIRAALPETVIKRDKILQTKQKQLATAISCVASTITEQLNRKDKDHDLLKRLMDMGRLLCDIQHTESVARRNFSLFSVKKEMKEHLTNTKIDKYLFGENFSEALKNAKAVNKSVSDLKVQPKNTKKNAPYATKTQPPKNWKHPAPARRQLGQQRSRETNSPREQPARSSKRSPPQSKTYRRR